MINVLEMSPTETVFTHIDEDRVTVTHVAVDRLAADPDVQALESVQVPVEGAFAEHCMACRGVESHRLGPLLANKIREPVLMCDMGDGTHLMVDGTHRYVASWMKGEAHLLARIVPKDVWGKYRITGMPDPISPEDLLGMFSGIMPGG